MAVLAFVEHALVLRVDAYGDGAVGHEYGVAFFAVRAVAEGEAVAHGYCAGDFYVASRQCGVVGSGFCR